MMEFMQLTSIVQKAFFVIYLFLFFFSYAHCYLMIKGPTFLEFHGKKMKIKNFAEEDSDCANLEGRVFLFSFNNPIFKKKTE